VITFDAEIAVTNNPPADQRPSLGELHDRALAESPDVEATGAARFMDWFDAEVSPARRGGARPVDAVLAGAPVEDAAPWVHRWWPRALAIGACAALLAWVVDAALSARIGSPAPAAPWSVGSATSPARGVVGSPADPASGDSCLHSSHAAGTSPLIDDFEDGNELVALSEGRNGYWVVLTDTDPAAAEPVLLPSRRHDGAAANEYALHVAGGRHDRWGASVQVELGPPCYDASAYRGIAFDLRGPGRVYAGVRTVDAVPVDRGGTCTAHCFESHVQRVDATEAYTHHVLLWSDLHQQGQAAPADPRRLSGIEFLVQPGDTPYDLWIDDVSFVR
jgi:hypothetical protein